MLNEKPYPFNLGSKETHVLRTIFLQVRPEKYVAAIAIR